MSETDGVAILELRGGKANAMSSEVLDRIDALVGDFERGPARAAVLTGYERYFSAGLALPLLVDLDRPSMKRFIERFGEVMRRVFACPKPIVAAINGHAIAGGCVLALECDWRILTDEASARIGLNETQLGIGLPSVVIEPLRMQVPAASLVPIALEGNLFAPPEALAIGLVHEVAPAAELLARATVKARTLAALPPEAVAQVKLALRRPVLDAIARHAAAETELWLDGWFTPGAKERLVATVAKLRK